MNNPGELDIGPLTWVKGEIDLALSRAGEALKLFAETAASAGGSAPPDLTQLKSAQANLHQAQGALTIVGLDGITQFSETIEQVLAALGNGTLSISPQLVDLCQRALGAVTMYLDDLVDGAPDQALRLLPIYRELMAMRGVAEASPADLFFPDLSLRPPRREREPEALAPEALTARLKAARLGFQRGLLKWLKGEAKGLTEMRNSVAVIEFTQSQPAARAFWWITLAFLDALVAGGVPVDAGVKRLCARIDAQIAKLLEGSPKVAERLNREALYYVATATASTEHIECVRAAYRLDGLVPATATPSEAQAAHLTRLPQLRAMRDTLVATKDEWDRYSSGIAGALPPFHGYARQLAEQGQALGQMDLARLVAAINAIASMLRNAPGANNADVALEIATALLLAENALEGFERLGVDFARQVDVMAGRLNALLRGEPLATLQSMELPQLDEISRRAQERLLMRQVGREILGNLAVIEQALDAFFRDHSRAERLAALSMPLKQVEGALAILGETRAVEVLGECTRQVAEFSRAAQTVNQQDCEALAKKLSALGFFVEQLQHGPADLDAILNPACTAAATAAVVTTQIPKMAQISEMAQMTRTAIGALRLSPEDEGLRTEIRQHLETIRDDAGQISNADIEEQAAVAIEALESASPESAVAQLEQAVDQLVPLIPPPPIPSPDSARLAAASSEVIDAELLAIFLEEAHEVLATTSEYLQRSLDQPNDHEALRIIRRAFHTLKGSGRMVGLSELGESAWAVEQVMNHWLRQELDATLALHQMLKTAKALFSDWVARLESGDTRPALAASATIAELHALCEQLRSGREPPAAQLAPPPIDAEKPLPETMEPAPVDDRVIIGELRLTPTVYDIYLTEACAHLATLQRELPALQQASPSREMIRAGHTLGGISGTLGIGAVSMLARSLEAALERFAASSALPNEKQGELLEHAVDILDSMLAAFAIRLMPKPEAGLIEALDHLSLVLVPPARSVIEQPAAAPVTAAEEAAAPFVDARRKLRIHDDIDAQLLPVFLEEGADLLREIGAELRTWRAAPEDRETARHLKRLLHTLKGGARMAGAMRMGELVHGIETRLVQGTRSGRPAPAFLDEIDTFFDRALTMLDNLMQHGGAQPAAADTIESAQAEAAPAEEIAFEDAASSDSAEAAAQRAHLRVRAELVDQLINEAGEMTIARGRIEAEMRELKSSLLDLTENVIRLRQQLREVEIQAESQMQSQISQMQEAQQQFDPLEMDRFTRFQELTRMMAESVNDVTTVQHSLLRNLDHANAALGAQARLNRELSQALMGVRTVPFNSIIDRLYRVVRQVAKELDKRVNFDLRGAQIELDRSVLEKMVGPLEHLLRNAIAHGIESRVERRAAGKADIGEVTLTLTQQGNEVVIELADDGAGLDFSRIRAKAIEHGLLGAEQEVEERRLTQFIFLPGFSTATQLSELAGRGIGMDVVKAETTALGGRIEVNSQPGQGTRFRIYLPLTLAVAQALLIRTGNRAYALPSTMVEQVMELKPDAAASIRAAAGTDWLDTHYPWHYLAHLLGDPATQPAAARRHWILLLKGGEQHLALEVDSLIGNQEIVVKNIGPQLARVPGITGATVLNDGEIAPILNPFALVSRKIQVAQADDKRMSDAAPAEASIAPMVMVVDDSLTVRHIIGRLLTREGYQVITAKDGVDALDQLLDCIPAVMLVDIEMPRMDGFDLTRNIRGDARLKDVPIIMITSRIAEKHRNYAKEIGVNEYLGKPYDDAELLRLIANFVARQGMRVPAKT